MALQDTSVTDLMETDIWTKIREVLDTGIHFGEGEKAIDITLGLLLMVSLAFIVASFVLKWLRFFFTRNMEGEDKLKFISVFKFIKYVVYLAVIFLTMNAAGINITLLLTASAVLFVGLGLALQDLFQDVIAGISIMLDKSVAVGDIVEVEGKVGKVFEIKLRTTRAITRDDKVIIIPNHKFISDIIFNYTQNHKTTREEVTVGVAYGSNVNLVAKILLECVQQQKRILKNPKPFVTFDDFGDSALLFSVHFFISDPFSEPTIKSDIRYRIDAGFRKHQITIPFPQRDVHFYQNRPLEHHSVPRTNPDTNANG